MLAVVPAHESPLRAASLTIAAALALASQAIVSQAWAGDVACSFEGGVLVAPAEVAGIAGDYIIDTGQAATVLHNTRAEGAGLAEPGVSATVLLGGLESAPLPVAIVDLDARTAALPTPVAGVIGVDALSHYLLDVGFSPCRIGVRRLKRPGAALPPLIKATVSDGRTARRGHFVVSTGQAPALQLSEVEAEPPPAVVAGEAPAARRMDRLSVADQLFSRLETQVVPADSLDPRAIGVIGAAALSAFTLRFDFARERLTMEPAR